MGRQKDGASLNPLVALLLEITEQALDRKSWHGTTLLPLRV